MAGSNSFKETVESLFHGMDSVITSKTVVGEAIHINGTIILPLMDVSFGIGAGSFNADKKEKGLGGIGMVPDVIDRFTSKDEKLSEDDVADILDSADESSHR